MKNVRMSLLLITILAGCADSRDEPLDAVTNDSQRATTTDSADDTLDAADLLASTLAQAKSADKRVLVHLGAPW